MQTNVTKNTATVADKAAAAAKRKAAALAKQAGADKAAKPAENTAPKNTHIGTVSTLRYTGPSGYLNTGAKPAAINVAGYAGKAAGSLTIRSLGLLAAMRDSYKTASFPARGFDIAILSMLAGCTPEPLIKLSGGATVADKNGVLRLTDMPGNPVTVTITATGQTYGKATVAKTKPKPKA
jgi:hypothetical protein